MRAILPAALCVAALAVAACGDDDEEATTVIQTTTVTETETVVTTPPETETETTAEERPEREPEDDDSDDRGEGGDGAVTAPVSCGRLAFEPNTDSGASGITAVGTDCQTAKAVARAAQDHRGDELAYESRGFTCRGTRRGEAALETIGWVCLRGAEFIRFGTT